METSAYSIIFLGKKQNKLTVIFRPVVLNHEREAH